VTSTDACADAARASLCVVPLAAVLRGSLIVTSNLAFAEWTEVFGEPRLTSALLDRLTHRCHILELAGESYRFRQSLQQQADSSELSKSERT
jgi:DNA replication protein DnaC